MKYKVGDKVKLKSKEGLDEIERQLKGMALNPEAYDLAGAECAIYNIVDGGYIFDVSPWVWSENMIEGLVEEENPFDDNIPLPDSFCQRIAEEIANSDLFKKEPLDIPTMITDFVKEHGLPCPQGYIFKDENGNVINATKIVLEKKKKEYPKSYEECCKVLNIPVRDLDILDNMLDTTEIVYSKNLDRHLNSFRKLLICRDAYWKIAGEEMGLDGPWEIDPHKPCYFIAHLRTGGIIKKLCGCVNGNANFAFPTEEMRDAFKENFDPYIEFCKEFL